MTCSPRRPEREWEGEPELPASKEANWKKKKKRSKWRGYGHLKSIMGHKLGGKKLEGLTSNCGAEHETCKVK